MKTGVSCTDVKLLPECHNVRMRTVSKHAGWASEQSTSAVGLPQNTGVVLGQTYVVEH